MLRHDAGALPSITRMQRHRVFALGYTFNFESDDWQIWMW